MASRSRLRLAYFLLASGASFASVVAAEEPTTTRAVGLSAPPADIAPNVPADFPRFVFGGNDEAARYMNRYLWHHFDSRLGNGKTLFNKEYLTVADLWLAGAIDKRRKKAIQEVHREDILGIGIDEEGYVHTHQHFSHAHDLGWPFPLWTQSGPGPDDVKGVTAGWHFQPDGPAWMWIWPSLKGWNRPEYFGETAAKSWELENCRSLGIVENRWRVEATGPSPTLTTPAGMTIDAFNAPYLQLRWKRSGQPPNHALPYIEWLREGESEYGPDRRVYLNFRTTEHASVTGTTHTIVTLHRHPKWTGRIVRMRLSLAPGESKVVFDLDSFFTVYDTRHSINNPLFVFASANYFAWTGDVEFLRANINRMRLALRYQMTDGGGLENNLILCRWPGHDGISGLQVGKDGSKKVNPGHGIGTNYYDLLPFGWKDAYATMQYYACLIAMAEVEEAIRSNPAWDAPLGALSLDPRQLREHAAAVKRTGNEVFWNGTTGRYVACIDRDGKAHDYGYTWLGLEAIWYDFATPEHATAIMDWITGKRIVEGDTSTGADIYRWRFGPRVSTLRNVEWYGQGWLAPEAIPWGGQIQDGGAVLGFAFYDLWARTHVLGADDAWQRLLAIVDWEKEVWAAGGYRAYYQDGKPGTTLQGGGTAGGIGVDCEFYESSLIPAAITQGLLGVKPSATELRIAPKLPKACPSMGVRNVLYRNVRLDVQAADRQITVAVKDEPPCALRIRPPDGWSLAGSDARGPVFEASRPGVLQFIRP